jgi:hypothetical protein
MKHLPIKLLAALLTLVLTSNGARAQGKIENDKKPFHNPVFWSGVQQNACVFQAFRGLKPVMKRLLVLQP